MNENEFQVIELLTRIAKDVSGIRGLLTFWGILTILGIFVFIVNWLNSWV